MWQNRVGTDSDKKSQPPRSSFPNLSSQAERPISKFSRFLSKIPREVYPERTAKILLPRLRDKDENECAGNGAVNLPSPSRSLLQWRLDPMLAESNDPMGALCLHFTA